MTDHPLTSDRLPWKAWVAPALGVLWLGGMGSIAAIWLGTLGLRRDPSRQARRWLIAAIAIGIIGLLVTVVSVGLLSGSAPHKGR